MRIIKHVSRPGPSVSDYDCDFGGVLPSPPPAGGHSSAWVAAVVSFHRRRRGACRIGTGRHLQLHKAAAPPCKAARQGLRGAV